MVDTTTLTKVVAQMLQFLSDKKASDAVMEHETMYDEGENE